MTTANDADRPPAADNNGASTLRDRVRSLRLAGPVPQGPRRSLVPILLPWCLCIILGIVTAALAFRPIMGAAPKDGPAAPAVTDKVASSGDVALEAKGYIIPVHQIQVSPKVAGMLVWIDERLEEGARFNAGDVLAKIEDVDYRTTYLRAKHSVAAATKRKEQANANLAGARATLAAKEDAYSRNMNAPGGVARADLIQSQGDRNAQIETVKAQEAAVLAAEADEEAANADLEKADWNLKNCEIKAPVTGTVLKKSAERGNIVNPIAFNISASLCDMADLSDLEVDLKIQERDIAKVAKGQPCIAMPEAYENDPTFLKVHAKGYTGKVSRLMPTADRGQGAIPVRVKLDIPKEEEGVYLKPDMGVSVEFLKN